jgi:hypothetical protein
MLLSGGGWGARKICQTNENKNLSDDYVYTGSTEEQGAVADIPEARRQQHILDFPGGIEARGGFRQITVGAFITGEQYTHRRHESAQVEMEERSDYAVRRLARLHDNVPPAGF